MQQLQTTKHKRQKCRKNTDSISLFRLLNSLCLKLCFCAAIVLSASETRAVTLAWDQSDGATGYKIFYGEQSVLTNSSTQIDAGDALQYTIASLTPGHTYYFAAKAYNGYGDSSFSTQISYTVPATGTTSMPLTTVTTTTAPAVTTIPVTTTAPATTTTTIRGNKGKKHILSGRGANVGTAPALAADGGTTDQTSDIEDPVEISAAWDDYNALNGEARISTGDIDGDGQEEIVIGLGPVEGNHDIPGGFFQILDHDLNALGWGRIGWDEYNSANGESWPACGDIDGDGKDEILIGLGVGGNGLVEVFKFTGGKAVHDRWIQVGWDEYCKAGGGVRPACGNIDSMPGDEIVLGLYAAKNNFSPQGRFEVLHGSGSHLAWGSVDWPDYNNVNGETRPVCGAFSGSLRDEILVGLGRGSEGHIPVFRYAAGQVTLEKWLQAGTPAYRAENGETRLSCGDIDDDGLDEILVGFGAGGSCRMELHDDLLHDFALLSSPQIPAGNVSGYSGETYPAIQGIKYKFPKIINFLLRLLSPLR